VDNHTERGAGGRQYGTSEKDKQTLTGQNNTSAARLGTVEERSSQLARRSKFASFPCQVADIRNFNHVSAENMVALFVVVLGLGLIGFASTIAAGAKLKGGYYALCVLAILATVAAVFDVIWVLVNVSLSGFSSFFTAISSFWAFTYWVAVHNLKPRLNQSPALAEG
jgi:hypothetical protein